MASRVQEESSSSQSDNGTVSVVAITKRGTPWGEHEVHLSDGSSFFMVVHADDGLSVGHVISADELPAYVSRVEPAACRERALALLGRAEQSRDSLAGKLRARGYAPQSVRVVLDELEHDGIVDDARFSEVWLHARVRRTAEGPRALVAGLVRRGVTPDVAESAVASFIADNPDVRTWALRRATEKILRVRSMTPEELQARLLRKGFTRADFRDTL